MKQTMRFVGSAMIVELEQIYRDRYRGHEADILFQPHQENTLDFDIRIEVPHIIADSEEAERQFSIVINRCLREAARECERIASEIKAKTV